MFISVTRLRLKGKRMLPRFFLHTIKSIRQAKKANGLIHSSVNNEGWTIFWTLTIWENKECMTQFRNSGNHLEALRISRKIADELEKINWESDLIPSWIESKELLHQHYGRIKKSG